MHLCTLVRVLLTVTALSVLMSVRSSVSGGPLSDLLAQRAIIEEFNHGCDLTQVYTNTTGCAECVPGSSQSWVGSHFSSSVYVSTYECVCVYMGVRIYIYIYICICIHMCVCVCVCFEMHSRCMPINLVGVLL
jgi:hypothetical protein